MKCINIKLVIEIWFFFFVVNDACRHILFIVNFFLSFYLGKEAR